jgi:hypothetical protein
VNLNANVKSINGLTTYWPIISGSMTEYMAGMNLATVGAEAGFRTDRFGNANGALFTSSAFSYWQCPSGVYFSDDFTITGWIYFSTNYFMGLCKLDLCFIIVQLNFSLY